MSPTAPRRFPPRGRPLPTVRVSNFKSIEAAEFSPAPLTIVAGVNSSGKSSLLQALLFCVQSYGEVSTVINGDLVRLGRPNDVVRAHTEQVAFEFAATVGEVDPASDERRWIEYAMRVSLRPGEERLVPHELEIWHQHDPVLIARESDLPKGMEQREGEDLLAVSPDADAGLPEESWISVSGLQPHRVVYPADRKLLKEGFDDLIERAAQQDFEATETLWSLSISIEVDDETPAEITDSLQHKIQSARVGRSSSLRLDDDEREVLFRLYQESEAPAGWGSEPIGRPAMRRPGLIASRTASQGRNLAPLHRAAALISDRTGSLASSLLYLGPLREDPKVAYPLGHAASSLPVGEKGQFTAAFLEKNRRTKPPYVTPEGQARQFETLDQAVSKWSRYLEIGQSVSVKSEGKLGHRLNLTLNGESRDMTSIGVGASQLLPVVVLVLGAPRGALVLLEQPELHLHPAVQSRLADFFATARPDLKLVVETHSEYLITRLRRLVADGSVAQDRINVLFAEQTDGVTRFDSLELTTAGDFDHWPRGFFDTLDEEFVGLARAVTRARQSRGSDD